MARVPAVCKQNFSPLTSKLREEFEVIDGQTADPMDGSTNNFKPQ